jgi:hypothetical protein
VATTKATLERLTVAAEKLYFETERLCRDVEALNKRIEPLPGEVRIGQKAPLPYSRIKWHAVDALNVIDMARTHIVNCEHDLSAIRARIDVIESDALSRAEMKRWIKTES